jgi:hypothetical protein
MMLTPRKDVGREQTSDSAATQLRRHFLIATHLLESAVSYCKQTIDIPSNRNKIQGIRISYLLAKVRV